MILWQTKAGPNREANKRMSGNAASKGKRDGNQAIFNRETARDGKESQAHKSLTSEQQHPFVCSSLFSCSLSLSLSALVCSNNQADCRRLVHRCCSGRAGRGRKRHADWKEGRSTQTDQTGRTFQKQ